MSDQDSRGNAVVTTTCRVGSVDTYDTMHNKLKPGTMMAAVVKADGYGHGAEAVS